MEHYYRGDIYSICHKDFGDEMFDQLSDDDIEQIRHLPSFRPYVEQVIDCDQVIALLTDTAYMRRQLPDMIRSVRRYFACFHCALRILVELLHDVPTTDNISFKQLRSLYADCAEQSIATLPEFAKCWSLLALMSKTELIPKLKSVSRTITLYLEQFSELFHEPEVGEVLSKVKMAIFYEVDFFLVNNFIAFFIR